MASKEREETGRIVAQRYALRTRLGQGGMGVVWLADDQLLQRRVAVKEVQLPSTVPDSEQASIQARVLREARAAGRISDSAAVTVFDVHKEDGKAFIVMELVEAPTLADLVKSQGALPPATVAAIALGVLGALENAHKEGIVHRDVKPGNVMVSGEGRVKLADFGIASLKDDPKITATGLVLGSPSFMAPEQAEGRPTGPELDLWALGATMYFAVEGEPPFDRGGAIPTLTAVIHDEPRPMRKAGPLEPVIAALLSKEPAGRPSEPELRMMLEAIAGGGAQAPAVAAGTTEAPPHERATTPASRPRPPRPAAAAATPSRPPPGRSRAWLAALAVVALMGAAAAAFFLNDDQPERRGEGRRRDRAAGRDSGTPPEPSPDEPQAPAGWATYADEETGFEVAYPSGWRVTQDSVDTSSTDFSDPSSSTYLRIDWTDSPGASPEQAWEDQAAGFSQTHENYEEIRIDPTTFKGMDAAIWEFTFTDGGADLHTLDLGFVTNDGAYGFALYWQTQAGDWDGELPTFEDIQASFIAPRA